MKIIVEHYSVDNIEWFKEHEGFDAFKCDILYDSKKIGEFSENYMNGPDMYSLSIEEIEKMRKVATEFFSAYSKDKDLILDTFNSNEDFFVRFLRNLKEASENAKNGQGIEISTSYPFEYKIYDNIDAAKNNLYEDNGEYKMFLPVLQCRSIVSIPKKEVEHELS